MTTILTYHHIALATSQEKEGLYVSPDRFEVQMCFLRNQGINVVSLNNIRDHLLGKMPLARGGLAITFDDGFSDIYENAFPILKHLGFTATVFVICDRIGTSQPGYLNKEQLIEMSQQGLEIGSHSLSHRRLTSLNNEEQKREIFASKKQLEDILNKEIKWFAYPYGNFSPQIIELVKEAGYHGAVSTIRDNRNKAKYLYYLTRVMVMPDTSVQHLQYCFTPLYHLIHRFKNQWRWKKYL